MNLSKGNLSDIYLQAAREYPEECCGFIALSGDGERYLVLPCRNIQNKLHQENPSLYTRDARTAYQIDPGEFMRISREIKKEGFNIIGTYHSHTDQRKEAYFSQEDRRSAFIFDPEEPVYQKYLVVSVMKKKVVDCRYYQWDGKNKDFIEHIIV